MSRTISPRIILQTLQLKEGKQHIPVAELHCNIPGPTILITGGVDGDEYVGIRAAYQLIDDYATRRFPGKIIIIPIVNIPGFYGGMSANPLDHKYPKHIYPGSKNGSASEQLMHWLCEEYISQASVWIDLHSGAISESLQPFIWAYETSNPEINKQAKTLLSTLNATVMLYEKVSYFSKPAKLARKNCLYLMFECGERGEQNEKNIQTVCTWVKQSLAVLHRQHPQGDAQSFSYFRKVTSYQAAFDGLWVPAVDASDCQAGSLGGTLYALDKTRSKQMKIQQSGTVLWMKSALAVRKYDDLMAIASDERQYP